MVQDKKLHDAAEEVSPEEVPAFPPELCVTERRTPASGSGIRQFPVAVERRSGVGRRDRGQRRRQVDPTTCERSYTDDDIEFMMAMDQYKLDSRRPFPTWSEVLEVLRALGYRKVAVRVQLPGLPASKPAKVEV